MHSSLIPNAISLFVLLTSLIAVASGYSGNLVVTYWGQGPNQLRLSATCENDNLDIVVISFVYQFPEAAPGGIPGTDFGNACGDGTYVTPSGRATNFKTNCPSIGPDIIYCQSRGKKVFLSLGGAGGGSYQYISNDNAAISFANFLIGAFGPRSATPGWTGPRPFGDAFVDGYDMDVESYADEVPAGTMSTGYKALTTRLKTSNATSISWSPQCIDNHITTDIMRNSPVDYLFIQFYNTPYCSAKSFVNDPSSTGFRDSLSYYSLAKPGIKVLIGLPASTSSADPDSYLSISQVYTLIEAFGYQQYFAGISTWDTTGSQSNTICGREFVTWLKWILTGNPYVAQSNYGQNCAAIASGASVLPSSRIASSTRVTSSVRLTTSSTRPTSTLATSSRPASSAASPAASSGAVSPDGTCGGAKAYKCTAGLCCSMYGFCGSTSAHCGSGCQPAFGICTNRVVTRDGSCGGTNGFTCIGGTFGNCCSQYNFCGSTSAFCGAGCQIAFGTCT